MVHCVVTIKVPTDNLQCIRSYSSRCDKLHSHTVPVSKTAWCVLLLPKFCMGLVEPTMKTKVWLYTITQNNNNIPEHDMPNQGSKHPRRYNHRLKNIQQKQRGTSITVNNFMGFISVDWQCPEQSLLVL